MPISEGALQALKGVGLPLVAGTTCAALALALDAWAWFTPYTQQDAWKRPAVMLVASNVLLVAFVLAEIIRRRRGWASPVFWMLLFFNVMTSLFTWFAWRIVALGGC